MEDIFRLHTAKLIAQNLDALNESAVHDLIELPEPDFGDYAFPCFSLAKQLRMSPAKIAEDLAGRISADNVVLRIEAMGSYVNFHIKKDVMSKHVIVSVLKEGEKYGSQQPKKKTIVI